MRVLDRVKIEYFVCTDGKTQFNLTKEELINYMSKGLVENATLTSYKGKSIVKISDKPKKSKDLAYLQGMDIVKYLRNCNRGTPMMITIGNTGNFKTVIYLGKSTGSNVYNFYDGNGITGMFELSEKFILGSYKVLIKKEVDNTTEVAKLLAEIKEKF